MHAKIDIETRAQNTATIMIRGRAMKGKEPSECKQGTDFQKRGSMRSELKTPSLDGESKVSLCGCRAQARGRLRSCRLAPWRELGAKPAASYGTLPVPVG